jgi:hypothetical protein
VGRPTTEERFWAKVDRRGPDECWPWVGSRQQDGYGQLWNGSRLEIATHIALRLDGRPLEPGQYALHRCDNPPCVNPGHLIAGDARTNSHDMLAKGRFRVGERRKEMCKRGLHRMDDTRRANRCAECERAWHRARQR